MTINIPPDPLDNGVKDSDITILSGPVSKKDLVAFSPVVKQQLSLFDRVVMGIMICVVSALIVLQVFLYLKPPQQIVKTVHEVKHVTVATTQFQWVKKNFDPLETWILSGILVEQGRLSQAVILLQNLTMSLDVLSDVSGFWGWAAREQIKRIKHLMHDPYPMSAQNVSWLDRLGVTVRPVDAQASWYLSLRFRELPGDYRAYQRDYEQLLQSYLLTAQAVSS